MNMNRISLFVVGLLSALTVACGGGIASPAEKEESLSRVQFAGVRHDVPLRQTLQLTGDVHLMDELTMPVYAAGGGRVEEVAVAEGDYVRRGQTLATMRATKAAALQRKLDDAQRALDLAVRRHQAVQQMVEAGLASESELLEAERSEAEAEGRLGQLQTQADLTHHGQGDLRTIAAPMEGYVVRRCANPGMMVSDAGEEPLFVLANVDRIWADLCVYESDMAQLREGSAVRLHFIALPDTVATGRVQRLSRTVDAESKVLTARVPLDNRDHRLRPGMFVRAEVEAEAAGRSTAVPQQAVVMDGGQNFVVLRCADSLRVQPVGLLRRTDSLCYLATPLPHGSQVATRGSLLLYQKLKAL